MIAVTELIDRKSEAIYGFLRREFVEGCLYGVDNDERNNVGAKKKAKKEGDEENEGEEEEHEEHETVLHQLGLRKSSSRQQRHQQIYTPCTYARLHAFATRTVLDVTLFQDDFDWASFAGKVCGVSCFAEFCLVGCACPQKIRTFVPVPRLVLAPPPPFRPFIDFD